MKKYTYTPSEQSPKSNQITGKFEEYVKNEDYSNISFGRITKALQSHFDYNSDFQQIVYMRVSCSDFNQLLYDEACMRRYKGRDPHEFKLNVMEYRSGPLVITLLDGAKQADGTYTIVSEPNIEANELRKKFNE